MWSLAGVDSQLADAARGDPVARLIAQRELVQKRWEEVTPGIRGQIIDAIAGSRGSTERC
jgi:hypothetical protein